MTCGFQAVPSQRQSLTGSAHQHLTFYPPPLCSLLFERWHTAPASSLLSSRFSLPGTRAQLPEKTILKYDSASEPPGKAFQTRPLRVPVAGFPNQTCSRGGLGSSGFQKPLRQLREAAGLGAAEAQSRRAEMLSLPPPRPCPCAEARPTAGSVFTGWGSVPGAWGSVGHLHFGPSGYTSEGPPPPQGQSFAQGLTEHTGMLYRCQQCHYRRSEGGQSNGGARARPGRVPDLEHPLLAHCCASPARRPHCASGPRALNRGRMD